MRSTNIRRSYDRAQVFRRGMLIVFFSIFVSVVLWAIPWLPYGLSVEDYNDRLTLLMLLMLAASVSAFGAVYMRDLSDRMEQTVITYNTVHEGLSDMRRREYFYDRIVAQCDMARTSEVEDFTVVALRLEKQADEGEDLARVEKAMHEIRAVIKDHDFIAMLGPHEIGVLGLKTGYQEALIFAEMLRNQLTFSLGDASDVRVGWAVYPHDGDEAGVLVGMARERLWRVGANRRVTADPPNYKTAV